jgi:uncharacterized repeat protein (TIGR03803 family)
MIAASVSAQAGHIRVVYDFRPRHGEYPEASLIMVGTKLYGTTAYGSTGGADAVFMFDPATGTEKIVHSFQGGSDGAGPYAGVIDVAGTLYGTTVGGGGSGCRGSGCGTVFSVNLKTRVETVMYAFQGGGDGAYPFGGLINVGGTLYGTALEAGSANCNFGCGTVFSVDPNTGAETLMYSFQGNPDGADPNAGLIDVAGTLYGTTQLGGDSGQGTVFSLNPKTGGETVLHTFQPGSGGEEPYAGLTNVGGTLYGAAWMGGVGQIPGYRTIYTITR